MEFLRAEVPFRPFRRQPDGLHNSVSDCAIRTFQKNKIIDKKDYVKMSKVHKEKKPGDEPGFFLLLCKLLMYSSNYHIKRCGVVAAARHNYVGVSLVRLNECIVHRLNRGEILLDY